MKIIIKDKKTGKEILYIKGKDYLRLDYHLQWWIYKNFNDYKKLFKLPISDEMAHKLIENGAN